MVDEIQRVPELLNVVHELMESGVRCRFVLTGSSARKLRRGGANLLAGRAILRTMHPFMARELGSGFDLSSALALGTVPTVLSSDDPPSALAAYASLYVEQEVRSEGLTRDVGSFSRFLEAAAFSHAATLNVSEVRGSARRADPPSRDTSSCSKTCCWHSVSPSSRGERRGASLRIPRFFYFDCGVFRSLRPRGPLDRPDEIAGPALEGLIAQHLRAWLAYSGTDGKLYYWRTRAGAEVDFVVYGASGIWGIDVMNADRIRPADLRGLRAFGDEYPEARLILLHRGEQRMKRNGVLCLPVDGFLASLDPARGLEDMVG